MGKRRRTRAKKVAAPLEFIEACGALDEDALSPASTLASGLVARYPDIAEPKLLTKLVGRRRAAPDEPWLDAFVEAWVEEGRPRNFGWKTVEDFDGQFERVLAPVVDAANPRAAMKDALDAEFPQSPLLGLLTEAWKPGGGDQLIDSAIAAMPRAHSVEHLLWLTAMLGTRLGSPAAAERAAVARREIYRRMIELRPNDFQLRAGAILDDGCDYEAPLSAAQLKSLLHALEDSAGSPLSIGMLYDHLVRARSARSVTDHEGAFQDAVGMLPEALAPLRFRTAGSLRSAQAAVRHDVVALLIGVGERFRGDESALGRLLALGCLEVGLKERGDGADSQAAAAEIAGLRRMLNGERLSLEWPIAKLRIEACYASAHHEVALLRRTVVREG